MATDESNGVNLPFEVKPHAYDPVANPELFADVLPRRVVAFIIDLVILAIPVALAGVFIFAAGIVTFGFGFFLFPLLPPAAVIWGLGYYGFTLGSAHSATIGMRMMDLEMRTWYGAPAYFVLGAVYAVLFWVSVTALTPLILLVGFFNERRRLLHDILLGVVIINNASRANKLKAAAQGG
ncbi:MAG TPA: RDD family protein [Xanthobacteraceae bacterium]|nr:RDD family protein [Xanthobacteraceae bacterium]